MALLNPYENGGKVKVLSETITLASQAAGTIDLFTIPEDAVVKSFEITSSASLGSATIAIGISGDTAKYKAAATFTTANVPTKAGKADALMTPLTASEDVILTTATAALPASGTLHVVCEYVID